MDRVVKIWRVHDYQGQLRREDKPLYSSTLVHRSAAASVVWCVGLSDRWVYFPNVFRLSEDTLLTHCTSTAFASHRDIVLPKEQLKSSKGDKEDKEGKEDKEDEEDVKPKEWTGCPGRVVIFRWLGLNRFFPPAETKYRSIQRGCVSVSCIV